MSDSELEKVGETDRGYSIYRKKDIIGHWEYYSDEIGGGVMVLTQMVSLETLKFCIKHLEENQE